MCVCSCVIIIDRGREKGGYKKKESHEKWNQFHALLILPWHLRLISLLLFLTVLFAWSHTSIGQKWGRIADKARLTDISCVVLTYVCNLLDKQKVSNSPVGRADRLPSLLYVLARKQWMSLAPPTLFIFSWRQTVYYYNSFLSTFIFEKKYLS